MPRGRKPIHPAVKALRGNPGGKALPPDFTVLDNIVSFPAPVPLEYPAFLTGDRERSIFKSIIEDYLQRRVARKPDFGAFGRWAHYMHRWIVCKEQLEGQSTFLEYETAAGKQIRRHPLFRDMIDIEAILHSLENDLGLNPMARHTILRGLTAMPAAYAGEIFPDTKPAADDRKQAPPSPPPVAASPLGFLQQPDKLN